MHKPEPVQENETHTILKILRFKRIIPLQPKDMT